MKKLMKMLGMSAVVILGIYIHSVFADRIETERIQYQVVPVATNVTDGGLSPLLVGGVVSNSSIIVTNVSATNINVNVGINMNSGSISNATTYSFTNGVTLSVTNVYGTNALNIAGWGTNFCILLTAP